MKTCPKCGGATPGLRGIDWVVLYDECWACFCRRIAEQAEEEMLEEAQWKYLIEPWDDEATTQ